MTSDLTGIRTFLALPLEPVLPVRERMQQLQKQLPSYRIKWVNSGQFHLTLFFFGEIDAQIIPLLADRLQSEVTKIPCFTYSLGEPGIFSDRSGPRVLWLGIEAPSALYELKKAIDHAVAPLGFRSDDTAFHPHITLGRFLPGQKMTPSLYDILTETKSHQTSPLYSAKHLILFKSELFPAGPRYTPLARLDMDSQPPNS
ncbi:MAG: RNA 2',3'-cyclic phosphodiesterase [Bacteroidales bacterium]|jgi:2'-5' RNA ligase|nr:RNA 2',3'-cyclic phosphodiesterase [Bacteroidales bacterium]